MEVEVRASGLCQKMFAAGHQERPRLDQMVAGVCASRLEPYAPRSGLRAECAGVGVRDGAL